MHLAVLLAVINLAPGLAPPSPAPTQRVSLAEMLAPGAKLDVVSEEGIMSWYQVTKGGRAKKIWNLGDLRGLVHITSGPAALSFVQLAAPHRGGEPGMSTRESTDSNPLDITHVPAVDRQFWEGKDAVIADRSWRKLKLHSPVVSRHGEVWTIVRPVILLVDSWWRPFVVTESVRPDGAYEMVRRSKVTGPLAKRIRWDYPIGD